ncbi:MAG: alanine racemase, partial [Clostridia bacterium]|nr:alanine racemase [Clostridia bacterium]
MYLNRICAKIDMDAVRHNIAIVKNKICGTSLMFIIKADAYGHGAKDLSKEFENEVDYFAVAEMREALELRENGISKPILILGYTSPSQYATAMENDITLTVISGDHAKELSDTALGYGKKARVHFALDTGMGRIGWQTCESAIDEIAEIASMEGIEAEGIFSHFAVADDDSEGFTNQQKLDFKNFVYALEQKGVNIPLKHMNNSAAILEHDEQYSIARAGIVLYGLYPSEKVMKDTSDTVHLRPAMELISHVAYVKELDAGRSVSYGRTYITDKKTRIATIPVGYADGYPRSLSNKGEVLIKGVRCPIIGRIC